MDEATLNATEYYGTQDLWTFSRWYAHCHGYTSLTVCAFGIVCNLFNIIVLTRPNMVSTTNIILTGLAVSDLLTMVSYVPFALNFYVLHGLEPTPMRNSRSWIIFFMFHVNFSVTTHTTSIWLGVLLSAFRYAYVRLSREGSAVCSITRARTAIIGVYAGSVVILIPNYLSIRIVSYPNQTKPMYDVAGIDTSSSYGLYVTSINFWIHALLIKIIPCALMSIFGFLLVGTMRHTHKRSQRLRRMSTRVDTAKTRNRKRDHSRTTRMLVVVIVLFLLTELPQGILALLSGLLSGFFEAFYVPLGDTMDIVALINNAINFILYCTMSKQFRDTFLRLFCGRSHHPVANGTSYHDNNVTSEYSMWRKISSRGRLSSLAWTQSYKSSASSKILTTRA